MPLLLHTHLTHGGELGLWRITETEQYFLDLLLLYPAELRQLATIKGRRRVEWLAVRQLVHEMSGRRVRGPFVKDEFGKPRLLDTDWHLSISHSHELAGAIASPHLCGIDVQFIVPKITRLAPKFLNEAEAASLHDEHYLDQLHFYWGAKEALYKAHGRRQLDFKANILVTPFTYTDYAGQTTARVVKEGEETLFFKVWYERSREGYMLVWALETAPFPEGEKEG